MEEILTYIQSQLAITNFKLWQLIIFGIFAVAFIIQFVWWIKYFGATIRYNRKVRKNKVKFDYSCPKVSVIICAKDEEFNLKKNLPLVLSQFYPNYEVIVVNDGSYDKTEMYLAQMKEQHSNLRTTYIPKEAKLTSHKKFGLTLGIKASADDADILVFTDADCKPESKDWLGNMVRNFTEGTDIVLGYGAYEREKSLLNCMQLYDTLFIAMQYFGYSRAGHTYMGVGRNLAYRKELFFKVKGFASHIDIQSGDDDLFISQVATPTNTRIEFQHGNTTISEPKHTFTKWCIQKERHLTTGSRYKSVTKWLIGTELATRVLFYAGFVATLCVGNLVTAAIAVLLFLMRYLTQFVILNKTATILSSRHYYTGIVFMDIVIPVINMILDLINKKRGVYAYRWK